MNDNLQDVVLDLKSRLEALEARVATLLDAAPAPSESNDSGEGGSSNE